MISPSFSFNRENARHVWHVFLWTVASAFVTLCITLLANINVAPEYLFYASVVNTVLVALKEFISEQRNQ